MAVMATVQEMYVMVILALMVTMAVIPISTVMDATYLSFSILLVTAIVAAINRLAVIVIAVIP